MVGSGGLWGKVHTCVLPPARTLRRAVGAGAGWAVFGADQRALQNETPNKTTVDHDDELPGETGKSTYEPNKKKHNKRASEEEITARSLKGSAKCIRTASEPKHGSGKRISSNWFRTVAGHYGLTGHFGCSTCVSLWVCVGSAASSRFTNPFPFYLLQASSGK